MVDEATEGRLFDALRHQARRLVRSTPDGRVTPGDVHVFYNVMQDQFEVDYAMTDGRGERHYVRAVIDRHMFRSLRVNQTFAPNFIMMIARRAIHAELIDNGRDWHNEDILERRRITQDGIATMGWDVSSDFYHEQRKAQARALETLMANLTQAQKYSYNNNKHFTVRGSDTGKRYRIKHAHHSNIFLLDNSGKEVRGYCFVPADQSLPVEDILLFQKLCLECDENESLKIANHFNPGAGVWYNAVMNNFFNGNIA